MTKVSRALAAGFACVVFSVTSFAGGPFGIIHVGKWQGAAYTTDKGAFSHCTAIAKFDSGLAIILAQNANRSWIIGVAAPGSLDPRAGHTGRTAPRRSKGRRTGPACWVTSAREHRRPGSGAEGKF